MQTLHGVNMTPSLSVELQISLLARRYEKLDNNNASCEWQRQVWTEIGAIK